MFPVFETARALAPLEPVAGDEFGAVMVRMWGQQPLDDRIADVEEPDASGSAQVLAAGGRQQVAADLVDVDHALSDRLARIEQERHLGRPGDFADVGSRVDKSTVGRHVGERDERDDVRAALVVVLTRGPRCAGPDASAAAS